MHESMKPVTGKGVFDDALDCTGTAPLAFHAALLRCGASNWGRLEDFLLIEDEVGAPVAAMSAFSNMQDDLRPLTASGFEQVSAALDWPAEAARGFWLRYVRLFGFFGKAPQLVHAADYVLEYAAVRPDCRGQGHYSRLLAAHGQRARSLGHGAMSFSAVIGNDVVTRPLREFGFREAYKVGPEVYRFMYPGMIRYRCELPAD
ncbi:hypothetical protein [Sphingomonas ginkgonis]|nr:hypothetical protein [Sphingomonas ginkgonis]